MSGGRMKIPVRASGESVPADSVFDAVVARTVEIGHVSALSVERTIPADRSIFDEYIHGNSRALKDLQDQQVLIARMLDRVFAALYRATQAGLKEEIAGKLLISL